MATSPKMVVKCGNPLDFIGKSRLVIDCNYYWYCLCQEKSSRNMTGVQFMFVMCFWKCTLIFDFFLESIGYVVLDLWVAVWFADHFLPTLCPTHLPSLQEANVSLVAEHFEAEMVAASMLRLGISIKQTGHQSAHVFIDSRMSKVIYVYINIIIYF